MGMETHEPQAGPLLVFGGRPLLASQHITSFPCPVLPASHSCSVHHQPNTWVQILLCHYEVCDLGPFTYPLRTSVPASV